jgi:hypothetical protein
MLPQHQTLLVVSIAHTDSGPTVIDSIGGNPGIACEPPIGSEFPVDICPLELLPQQRVDPLRKIAQAAPPSPRPALISVTTSGMAALDDSEEGPAPTRLRATTVTLYFTEGSSPVTWQGLDVVMHSMFPGVANTL